MVGKKLDGKEWEDFNNHQRIHQNYLEGFTACNSMIRKNDHSDNESTCGWFLHAAVCFKTIEFNSKVRKLHSEQSLLYNFIIN